MHSNDQSGYESVLPLIQVFAQSSAEKFQGLVGGEGLELPHLERLTFGMTYTPKKPQTLLLEDLRSSR